MSVVICAQCGRYVDTDREEVLAWMENGDVICDRLACAANVDDDAEVSA